ncbi:MAG: helix-turn-helix domain-containing protein [Parachlamydiales bacterium]|nr:helix-turn-helix domain-containing protein [Parachlamydiales bacterium]
MEQNFHDRSNRDAIEIRTIDGVAEHSSSKTVVSITEAARLNNVTRQAIYVAIKLGKLQASKNGTRWMIRLEDLKGYNESKYSRTKSVHNGELVFDNTKGFYSINQVAKMLDVPAQKIYYATRIGQLKASRKGAAWVIHIGDVNNYKANYLNRSRFFDEQVG